MIETVITLYIFYIKRKTFMLPILSWDRIEPRYFLRAQGQMHFILTQWFKSWTAFFIRTRLTLSNPIVFFAIAKIVFVGRHRTHITNGHCTRYAWIFSIWMVADRTIVLHSSRRVLLCVKYYNWNAGTTFGRVCIVLPEFDVWH